MQLQQRIDNADIPFFSETIKGDCGVFCEALLRNPFLAKTHYFENSSVPVSKIIGSGHPDYQNTFSWGKFLSVGKRVESALVCAGSSPRYYYSDEKKTGVSFVKIDNDYYIESGNHRSVIAKFLYFLDGRYNENLKGVAVTECFIDREAELLVEALNEAIENSVMGKYISVHINHHVSKRGIDKKCVIQQYETALDVTNSKTNKHMHIENLTSEKGKNEVRTLILAFNERQWWTALFSSNKYAKFIG